MALVVWTSTGRWQPAGSSFDNDPRVEAQAVHLAGRGVDARGIAEERRLNAG
jgi:hypothetical protein